MHDRGRGRGCIAADASPRSGRLRDRGLGWLPTEERQWLADRLGLRRCIMFSWDSTAAELPSGGLIVSIMG